LVSYVARRLGHSVYTLLGLSILIFVIARVLPGDPARMAVGPRAPDWVVQNLRHELNLDKPLHIQYYLWLKSALHGDLGTSLITRRPVMEDIKEFLPATLEVIALAAIVELVGAIALGALAAWYSGSWFDSLIRFVAYLGVVTPAFVWAIIFQLFLCHLWPVFPAVGRLSPGFTPPPPVTGFMTVDYLLAGNMAGFWDALWHLVLPAFSLSLGGLAQAARITRVSMADNLQADYVSAQTAAGIPPRLVVFKYVLRPSLIPTVSIIALDVAAMIANAFLVELIFNFPGISRYGTNAMLHKDLNAIVAVIVVLGATFAIANMIVDLLVAWLDPRIRVRRRV